MSTRPVIGVFDSGVGGLTVLKELVALVPGADYLYFGDTARLPYGSKSAETVARYAISAARFLEKRKIGMLVVACNTASALALPEITAGVGVPVIAVIEPGAEMAAATTKKKNVLVIGTEATIGSHAYRRALEQRGIKVAEKACPLFVPLIEEGWAEHEITQRVAHVYLDEFFQDHETSPDLLVLGCTHYPLIKRLLRAVAPWRVDIVDSAESTARAVAQQLGKQEAGRGQLKFFATDSVEKFRGLGARFLGHPVEDVVHVDLDRLG